MKNNKVGIYVRVSSNEQVIEGHSLEWQELELEKYASEHNLIIVKKYIEKGLSGESIEKRPQIKQLLQDIKDKKITNVLVYKVDRLGRQTLTNAIICKVLVENKCTLTTSAYGVIKLEKAYGSLIYNIISAISQFEVDNLSERVKNGKKQRVRNGLYINSYNVYGYDNYNNYDGERLLKINDFESHIIKQIYNLYLENNSMNNIAIELNNKNIPCKRGGKWHESTIYQILTNKLYAGYVIYRGNDKIEQFENKGKHQPIISEELFYKVQDKIKSKKKQKIKKLPSEYSYFSSVLICKENKSYFSPKQTKSKDKNSIRYYCKNKDCDFPSIKHIELEKIFAKKLEKIKINYSDKMIKEMFSNKDYDIILHLLNKLKQEQNDLFEYRNNNIIQENDFKERMAVISTKKQQLQEQLEKLKNKIVDYNDTTKEQVQALLNNSLMINFNNLSPKDKMNFINLFVEKIIIDKFYNIKIKWKRQ